MLKAASIVFNDGKAVIYCTMRNISSRGALLKVENSIEIPDAFELRFDELKVDCVVARRTFTELGVTFEGVPTAR